MCNAITIMLVIVDIETNVDTHTTQKYVKEAFVETQGVNIDILKHASMEKDVNSWGETVVFTHIKLWIQMKLQIRIMI